MCDVRCGTLETGMRCPSCEHPESRVIDSRPADQNASIRRRRVCEACDHRYTTYERHAPTEMVLKRSGEQEPFAPDKIKRGLDAALADRPVSSEMVEAVVEQVEQSVRTSPHPVKTEDIGAMVLGQLRTIDEIAYLRFASVYKEFEDAEDFERELARMDLTQEVTGEPTG